MDDPAATTTAAALAAAGVVDRGLAPFPPLGAQGPIDRDAAAAQQQDHPAATAPRAHHVIRRDGARACGGDDPTRLNPQVAPCDEEHASTALATGGGTNTSATAPAMEPDPDPRGLQDPETATSVKRAGG